MTGAEPGDETVGTGPFSAAAVGRAYDAVAADYDKQFGDDLAHLPVDRAMLDAALAAAPAGGWVLEAGCGPAPAATYLAGRTERMLGLDLSNAMLRVAGTKRPGLYRVQADIRRLPLRSGSCGLVVAFYTLQHVARAELHVTLRDFHRVLGGEGVLVVATHLGDGDVHLDELLGHRVGTFAGAFYRRDELLGRLGSARFRVEVERQRDPLPHEHASRRIYLLVRPEPA